MRALSLLFIATKLAAQNAAVTQAATLLVPDRVFDGTALQQVVFLSPHGQTQAQRDR
jgi:hypothetical protein